MRIAILDGEQSAEDTAFAWMVPIGHVMARLRKTHSFWDEQLERNGAYERRFARPHTD